MKKSQLKLLVREIVKELHVQQEQQSLQDEGSKLKALATAGLLGYAGLHTPQGQQLVARAQQTPIVQQVAAKTQQAWNKLPIQQAKNLWNQATAKRHVNIPNPNEPLPSEKNMSNWDLSSKYTNRNADVAQKYKPFVDRFLGVSDKS